MARPDYSDWHRDQSRITQRLQAEEYQKVLDRQAQERAAQARTTALDVEIRTAAERLDDAFLPAAQQLADALIERHAIKVEWTTARPACALSASRRIYTPPIVTPEDLATCLHEIGHVLNPACKGPNHQSRLEGKTRACVQCEVLASECALKLAPFSAPMHRDLAVALRSYLHTTPAPAAAQTQARRFISGAPWYEDRHRRMQHQLRQDAINEMRAWADEAAQPRPLTRREQQIADVRRWALEAGR